MSPLTPKLVFSGVFGLLYAGTSYLLWMDSPDAGTYAAIGGLSAFGLLLLALLLNDQRRALRLSKAEKLLPCQPTLRVGAKVRKENRVYTVQAYLCRDELILVNVEKKTPVLDRFPWESLCQAEVDSSIQLTLRTRDGRTLLMLSPYMEALIRELRKAGWHVTEKAQ